MSYTSIDDYICQQPAACRESLELIRQTIRQNAPEAEETISYQLPTFKFHGMLLSFAAFKNHYGIYPGPEAIEAFADKLSQYQTSKGAIQIPFEAKLPLSLIKDITKFRIKKNLEKLALKKTKKSK